MKFFLFFQFNIYIIYFLNPFNIIFLCLFNLIPLYPFNLTRINSFNSIRQNVHLIFGDWVKPWDQKDKGLGKNHCKYNMADEEGFDIGRGLLVFLASGFKNKWRR